MKKLLLILVCLPLIGWGQDKIILKDGEETLCKVIKVTDNIIEYKKYSNLEGPIYSKSVNEVYMIKYENGEKLVLHKFDEKYIIHEEYKEEKLSGRFAGILVIVAFLITLILVSSNQ